MKIYWSILLGANLFLLILELLLDARESAAYTTFVVLFCAFFLWRRLVLDNWRF